MELQVKVRETGQQTAVIEVSGEADLYTTPKLKETVVELIERGFTRLVVNLVNVDYLDSTALGVLVGSYKRVRERGGSLALVGPQPRIRKVFEITRLVKVFDIFDTDEQALASLGAGG